MRVVPYWRVVFLLLTLTLLRPCAAQQVEVTRYDVDQGLPQSMVNHVVQDSDGFMWLGTGDGLARFDGQRTVVYKHDATDSTSLSHNSIWGLAVQDATHLWVGTRTGLDRLDLRTGRFTRVRTGNDNRDGCWLPLRVQGDSALFYSPLLQALLIITNGTARRMSTDHIDSYVRRTSSNGRKAHLHLRPDSLLTIDLGNGEETVEKLPLRNGENVQDVIQEGHGWLVLTDRNGWLWNGRKEREELPADTRALLERVPGHKCAERAADGTLWLGISGVGVATLYPDLSVRSYHPLLPAEQRPLNINKIAFDRQGNGWVGTDGKGVFTIAPQRIRFGRCMPGQGLPWEPPSWFTLGFAQWDLERVLVSFYQGGLALFDERTLRLTPLGIASLGSSAIAGEHHMLTNDRAGRVWTKEGSWIRAIDPSSGRIVHQLRDTCDIRIGRSVPGDVLLASLCTPLRRVLDTRGVPALAPLHVPAFSDHMKALNNMPQRITMDREDRVWISSETAPLSVWSGRERVVLADRNKVPLDPQLRMTDLAEADDMLWMTSDQGLWQWCAKDLSLLQHFTVHDGLPDQFLYSLLPGEDGSWWISSNNGLIRADAQQHTFTNYTTSDGLQSKEFNSNAAFRSASGRLYFGGVNGFNHFAPDRVRTDGDTALVRMIGLTVQDSAVDPLKLEATPVIELPHGRNSMRIDLAVLEFSAPNSNRYRYRIEGYAKWTTAAPDRPITITNMPHGTYTVEVAGVNGHGLISDPRTLLTIHVPLPFWSSPWAYVLMGSMLVAVVATIAFLIYRGRVKQRVLHTEQIMKDLRIRTRLAQDLHDDVGSGLARIAALARMAEKRADRGDPSTEQVSKVGAISQELMDNLRDVVWMNDPRNGELAALLLRMKEHIRDLCEANDVQCSFTLPEPLPERRIGSAFKRNAFLIMKEAAHNAGKYSGAQQLDLSFAMQEQRFHCTLRDHGKGLGNGPVLGSGNGFTNMRQRAVELGAELAITSPSNGGTSITLSGPLTCLDL